MSHHIKDVRIDFRCDEIMMRRIAVARRKIDARTISEVIRYLLLHALRDLEGESPWHSSAELKMIAINLDRIASAHQRATFSGISRPDELEELHDILARIKGLLSGSPLHTRHHQ